MDRIRAHRTIYSAAKAIAIAAILCATVLGCGTKKETASAAPEKASGGPIAVVVAKPQVKTVQGELVLNGNLHAENEVQVIAETQGRVTGVFVGVGSQVAKGDVLAQIDDELKRASFDTAQAAFDKSKADWARAQDLFEQKVISEADRQGLKLAFTSSSAQLVMARRDLENARVKAPQAGVVTKTSVSVGTMLGPNAPVAYIIDTSKLKLSVQVGERDILKIKAGMGVEVDSDLYPGSAFSGQVTGISQKGDAALTFPIEIGLRADPRRPLYDGMSAKARIDLGARRILAIPRASLVGSYQKPQAYVLREGVARLVDIVAGGEYGTDLEILGGLGESDEVVVGGQNNLYDGAAALASEAAPR
jgi:membrane fusion protein (multidrug efflux system)